MVPAGPKSQLSHLDLLFVLTVQFSLTTKRFYGFPFNIDEAGHKFSEIWPEETAHLYSITLYLNSCEKNKTNIYKFHRQQNSMTYLTGFELVKGESKRLRRSGIRAVA